ncbi:MULTISPECIES: histidinol-phosphatase [unclassified Paenibacillus]|uniref:histidinol-phosphatase n=1 Tax=unclassified Paenibacillus TaxID=185978 RepID=UPI0024075622|nr:MULTISPECIES: histidinol-phosphatase [unclassified Paenibacillus]MDF9842701.1 histidinol-phosphatase (PHP family) [Paenibacillus sp. PastF-2]MDF9849431.1 histidinol-phosphatase (PHP family) [Paenibacillus sp. PastM-2]MDF9855861.1 histidinol-phosphatase (PHP family) [Paenibacillus sp. PastF-1]MDH6508692.1 histidinol-phosphatase (PHP family) [Paenibacillus sp. PastM-3]
MKFDLHTHHFRCGHADGTIRDYIEAGIAAGLSVIGISDHTPYFGHKAEQAFPHIAMAKSEIVNYVEEVLSLQKEYAGKIDVLLGIESDYFPEHAELYRATLAAYPFDYVIGSVHSVGGDSIFNKSRWKRLNPQQMQAVKAEYYRLIADSARSGMFQILGHIDAMKGNYPQFCDIPAAAEIDEALRVIGECGTAIEINTSGGTKLCGGWYPSDDILERALHYGVEVSFGSDAHKPSRVADQRDAVEARLKEIGFKEWVYYKRRERVAVPIE